MKKSMAIIICMAISFAVSSVVSTVCATEALAATTTEKEYGGTAKIILYSRPGTPIGWPPEMSYRDITIAQIPLESFLRVRYDLTTEPILATSWNIAPDMKSISFNLRKGVKFHDGTDWNAEAAKFNLDALMTAKKGEVAACTSIDVVDDYTLRVNLSRWENTILENIGTQRMVSPTAFKTMGLEKIRWNPVGTGAFKFVSHERDVATKFKRFDGYWQKGKPYLDRIELIYVTDAMTQSAMMKAGEADALWSPDLKVGADMKAQGLKQIYVHDGSFGLTPDSANDGSVFADKRVRLAILHAIDAKSLMKALGYGYWQPGVQLAPESMAAHVPDLKTVPFDPEKARALLKEAGYADGFKTKIIVFPGTSRQIMTGIQGYLAEVGIQADIDYPVMGKLMEYRRKGWKDALIAGPWAIYPNLGRTFTTYLTTTCGDYVSLQRPSGMDKLVKEVISTREPDPKEMQKVVRLMFDDVARINLFYIGAPRSMGQNVHDTGFLAYSGKDYWTPENVWMGK
jgi:peptide/nickel transport system substrate-binding protein